MLNCQQEPTEENAEVAGEQAAQVEASSVSRGPGAGGVGRVRRCIGGVLSDCWRYIGKSHV